MGATCGRDRGDKPARRSCADYVGNFVLGKVLPLTQLAAPGLTKEQQAEIIDTLRKKMPTPTLEKYRASLEKFWRVEASSLPRPAEEGGDLPILVHIPINGPSGMPAVIHAHGGSCVLGTELDGFGPYIYLPVAKEMMAAGHETAFAWVSVGYRLVPDSRFPDPVDDVVYAFEAMMDPGKAEAWGYAPGKVGLLGVSAGAYLASHASVRLARARRTPAFCAQLSPMVDPAMEKSSYQEYGDLNSLPVPWLRVCWDLLMADGTGQPPSEARKREVSLFHQDWAACKGMPSLLMTGRFEALYDDIVELAKLQQAAGLDVTSLVGNTSHILYLMLDAGAMQELTAWLGGALQS